MNVPTLPQPSNFIDFIRTGHGFYSWSSFVEQMRDAKRITETFSAVNSCRAKVEELAKRWNRGAEATHGDLRELERLQFESLRCIVFLYESFNLKQTLAPPDAPRSLQSLLRDALLLYHAASFRGGDPNDGLWYLLVLRFWDHGSLIKEDADFRGSVYDTLISLHGSDEVTGNWLEHARSEVSLSPECLRNHFDCLGQVNPGAYWEARERYWLDNFMFFVIEGEENKPADRREAAAMVSRKDDDSDWHEKVVEKMRPLLDLRRNQEEAVLSVRIPAARLLLEPFDPLLDGQIAWLLKKLNVPAHDEPDAAVCLKRIAREASRARKKVIATEKAVHLQRALAEVEEFRREFDTQTWFQASVREDSRPVKEILEEVESSIRNAIGASGIEPSALDIAARKEQFYFALLIDHENFFTALYDWIFEKWPNLSNHYDPEVGCKMFDYEHPPRSGFTAEKGRPMYLVNRYRWAYQEEHRILMRYVVQQMQSGWERYVGVKDLNYCRAYAYWGRHFPHAHDEVYGEFRIKPDRPRVAPKSHSQAVDQEIFAEVSQISATQKRAPFYVVVSGDAGYLEVLDRLHELHGVEYQYWFLEYQKTKRQLTHLRGRNVKLEDLLEMDKFEVSSLVAGMNERKQNQAKWGTSRR